MFDWHQGPWRVKRKVVTRYIVCQIFCSCGLDGSRIPPSMCLTPPPTTGSTALSRTSAVGSMREGVNMPGAAIIAKELISPSYWHAGHREALGEL